MKPKTFVVFVLMALFVTILLQNMEVVTVSLLLWKLEMSRVILIVLVMFIGMILGYIFGTVRLRRRRKSKEKREVSEEVDNEQ